MLTNMLKLFLCKAQPNTHQGRDSCIFASIHAICDPKSKYKTTCMKYVYMVQPRETYGSVPRMLDYTQFV